jgi:hypothetical protein
MKGNKKVNITCGSEGEKECLARDFIARANKVLFSLF